MKILPQKMWQFLTFKVILIVFAAHLVNSAMQDLKDHFKKLEELGFWIILDICKDGKEKYGNSEEIIKFLKEACDKVDETLKNIEILNAKEDKNDYLET
uniref:Uncharacterized protein n=1 Tax=Meloidogyne floridensis TaxID=298350 RepID=A0A915P7A8_9BILA